MSTADSTAPVFTAFFNSLQPSNEARMQRATVIMIVHVVLLTSIMLAATAINTPDQVSEPTPQRQLADVPSVRLHILLKGKHMQIHGQSVFDVFAKPVVSENGASVRYDGFATFIQGDLRLTYVLVDGAGYVVERTGDDITSTATQTVQCLSSVTPFDSIVAALNNLTAKSSGSVGDSSKVDCSSGTLYETTFGGEDFVVCASGASGFIAYGGDITMTVEYLDSPLRTLSTPKLNDDSVSCEVVTTPTQVTQTTAALLTGEVISLTGICLSAESC